MSKKAIRTQNAPQPPANFSHAVVANGMVYCAGVSGRDPKTGQVVSSDLAEQVDQTMLNLSAILNAADSSMEKVVQTTCYVLKSEDVPALAPAYAKFFPVDPPARAVLVVADFGIKGMKFEIIAIATI